MPNAAKVERGSILLAHFAEEVFAYFMKLTGGSSTQVLQTLAETSLLALLDTPDTYEDTAGLPLVSNGSATTFTQVGRVGIADDVIGPGQIDPEIAPIVHVRWRSLSFGADLPATPNVGDIVLFAHDYPGAILNGVMRYTGEAPDYYERWSFDWQKMRLVHVTEGDYAGHVYELVTDPPIALGSDAILYARANPDTGVTIGTDDTAEDTLQAWALIGDHGLETYQNEGSLVVRGEWRIDVVADANITLSGTATIDGVTMSTGMIVLAPNQTTGADRDIWVVNTAGAWQRFGLRLTAGQLIRVKQGTRYAGTLWELMTTAAITRGTTTLKWWRTDGRLISWLPATPDANNTIPSYLGRMYIPLPNLATIQRIYTLPADPIPGQEIWINYNATGTAQLLLRRNGTQTINGGTADHGIAVTNYRRAIAVYDLPTNNWLVNSFAV